MIEIYFDEAGNTGHDLLNSEQPLYVLSSIKILNDVAKQKLESSFTDIDLLHFKRKKNSASGRKEILDFWDKNFDFLNENSKSIVIHKKYMIVCQMLNYLVEPQLYEDGIDYYDAGMNIGHSNMMYMCIPGFCGSGLANMLYKAFINMFKIKDQKSIITFYKLLDLMEKKSSSEEFKTDIFILKRSITEISETLQIVNKYVLDPSMHSLISLITLWNNELEEEFNVFHDRSNTILNQKEILDFLNDIEGDEQSIGYGEFKATFPIKMDSFRFISSDNFSIKIVDIISSSLLYVSINDDDFAKELNKIISNWKWTNNIMPSSNVEPIPERIKRQGDIDSLDFFAKKIIEKGL